MGGAVASAGNAPLKRIAQIFVSNVDKKAVDGERAVRLCNYVDVYKHDAITGELPFMEATASLDQIARFTLRAGDVLITKDSETADDIAASAYVPKDLPGVVCGYHLAILRPRGPDTDGRYLHWAISSAVVREQFHASALGITRFGLRQSTIGEIHVPIPAAAAQRLIADFLDREVSRIDAMIRANSQMAQLGQERVAAMRYHLTRGHHDMRPKKRSEFPWVGEIPHDWEIRPLRHVGRLQAGTAFPHEYQGALDGTIPYVKVGDLADADSTGYLRSAMNLVTPAVAAELRSPILDPETLVCPKIGAALLNNRRAILAQHSCLDQNVMGLTIRHGSTRYYYHYLLSVDLGRLSTPGPIPLLNEHTAAQVQVPAPPLEEQERIALALDQATGTANAAADAANRQIALLEERRRAIITAAVTGRFEIPEAA